MHRWSSDSPEVKDIVIETLALINPFIIAHCVKHIQAERKFRFNSELDKGTFLITTWVIFLLMEVGQKQFDLDGKYPS